MKSAVHLLALSSVVLSAFCLLPSAFSATFSGNASISAGGGSAFSAASPNYALTVSCWFRLVIPTGTNITENMVILMDRRDGNESANFSFLLQFNINTGNIEFLTRGSSGSHTKTLIARPYLDRWYHVAVARQGASFYAYVDGRAFVPEAALVGDAVGDGLAIGGISGNSRLFRGDIIEVAMYRATLDAGTIRDRMFKDQRTYANLAGYYKLGYSTNSADLYRNFTASPPSGSDPATKSGIGSVDFEETDQAGEQSTFDSRKNRGEQALAPLSGAFSWSQVALSRPVPGIAFDFRLGYSSATPTGPPADGGVDPYGGRRVGLGWRHTFDTRVVSDPTANDFKLVTWEGGVETWVRSNLFAQLRTRHKEYRGELVQNPSGEVEWTTPERLVYRFHDPLQEGVMAGRLLEIRDFNSNSVRLLWNEDEGYITNVLDTAGGSYEFKYNTALGLLTNVSFGSWQVNFAFDATNRLISKSITNTSGLYTNVPTTWQFFYSSSNGLLERITDSRGNTNVLVQYDKYGRKTNTVDALGRATRTEYGVPGKRQLVTSSSAVVESAVFVPH